MQEENNQLSKTVEELTNKNKILSNRLREHGLDDTIVVNESIQDVAVVIKKAQVYQGMSHKAVVGVCIPLIVLVISGIFKYRHDDHVILLQRLIHDLTPRVAITLFPGLPTYILFMCMR